MVLPRKKAKTSTNKKTNKLDNNMSILDSLGSKNLDIIVAALLLTGKLRVDSVQLFRQASLVIGLTGKYKTIANMDNTNVDKMVKFLNDNGNMTLDEVIQALNKKTGQ